MKLPKRIIARGLIILFLASSAAVIIFPISFKPLAVMMLRPVESKLGKEIDFSISTIRIPKSIHMEKVIIREAGGMLCHLDTLDIKYNIPGMICGKADVVTEISGIRLYKDTAIIDSVTDMLAISRIPDVSFDSASGRLRFYSDAIHLKELRAASPAMRIFGSGWIGGEGILDCELNFSFSKELTDKMPDALKKALLCRDENGWLGMELGVTGNYKRPSIRISADQIELNIMEGFLK